MPELLLGGLGSAVDIEATVGCARIGGMNPKQAAAATVDQEAPGLVELSHRIHANPELGFAEHQASTWVAESLEQRGFNVERGICDLPTAFSARAGNGDLVVAICAEYDALPDVGHACGHNVIAAAAVGAGLALAPLADDLGITVLVLGTPAEEGGGGKVLMLDRGAFEGVHASMMVHPAAYELEHMSCLAVSHVSVKYRGKEAHASAEPEQGINAADAITVAQVAIGLLRQHIPASSRVHGIVTDGGSAPNIVPARAQGRWYIRSRTLAELAELEPRVHRCFEAGALATGASLEVGRESPPYSEFRPDEEMIQLYRANAIALGRRFSELSEERVRAMAGSTDMANVSLSIPTIHPMLGLDSLPASNHQPEFTEYCARPVADRALRDGALGMAQTIIDMATRDGTRQRLLRRELRQRER